MEVYVPRGPAKSPSRLIQIGTGPRVNHLGTRVLEGSQEAIIGVQEAEIGVPGGRNRGLGGSIWGPRPQILLEEDQRRPRRGWSGPRAVPGVGPDARGHWVGPGVGIPPAYRRRCTVDGPRADLQGTPARAIASTGALHAQGSGPCAQRYHLSVKMTLSGHATYRSRSGRSAEHGGRQQAAYCPPTCSWKLISARAGAGGREYHRNARKCTGHPSALRCLLHLSHAQARGARSGAVPPRACSLCMPRSYVCRRQGP